VPGWEATIPPPFLHWFLLDGRNTPERAVDFRTGAEGERRTHPGRQRLPTILEVRSGLLLDDAHNWPIVMPALIKLRLSLEFEGARTDWTSYAEINRPSA
jgi:hypothetical protein